MNALDKNLPHACTHRQEIRIRSAVFSGCGSSQPRVCKQAIDYPVSLIRRRGLFIAPDVLPLSGDTKLRPGTDSLEKSGVLVVLRQWVRARYKDMLAQGYYVADRSRRLADQALSLAAQRGRFCLTLYTFMGKRSSFL